MVLAEALVRKRDADLLRFPPAQRSWEHALRVAAVHMNYGNRQESDMEAAFLEVLPALRSRGGPAAYPGA